MYLDERDPIVCVDERLRSIEEGSSRSKGCEGAVFMRRMLSLLTMRWCIGI